ncbi:MAG: 4-hydroxy-tetrahydrodipicolinate reductase [Chloroflexi bacterium]|nr:4-hydroxy-tetrahydrodipicolinate reductase [Chloroflexota bacterium]
MPENIRVVVTGATGKMSREVLAALCREPGLEPVGAVSRRAGEEALALPDGSGSIPLSADLGSLLNQLRPDVLVDFTTSEYSVDAARLAVRFGVRPVVGTTGWTSAAVADLEVLCRAQQVGAVIAPNFALGAVVMTYLAKLAAPFFDYIELIELHHEQKADAPSGTAISMARQMAAARATPAVVPPTLKETVPGTRGNTVDGITVHSVRLPGQVAHHEIIFGGLGQTLRIRHDSISRESFMPGVVLAVREVMNRGELVFGLDKLLGLA